MLLSTAAYAQTPQTPAQQPSTPVPEADQKKMDEIVAEMQRLQTAFQLQQARLEAAMATAMARMKRSPDEDEIVSDGGKYVVRKKQPATAAAPKQPAKNP